MTLTPVEMPTFGGLDLRSDPQSVGLVSASDALNVSLDKPGVVRSRDGYAKFTSSAAAHRYINLLGFDPTDYGAPATTGPKSLYGVRVDASNVYVDRISTAGVATQVFTAAPATMDTSYALYDAGTGIVFGGAHQAMQTIIGPLSTVAAMATSFKAQYLALQYPDGRLAAASQFTVAFSNAGDIATWPSTNFVTFGGTTEPISGMLSWNSLLVVFRRSSYYVFYGNSVNGSGDPIFNFRSILNGVGCAAERGSAAGADGMYFIHNTGVYVTTGGPATCISDQIRGIFNGDVGSLYQGTALNQAAIGVSAVRWLDGKLFVAYPSGSSTTNDRLLVYENGQWSVWDIPVAAMTSLKVSTREDLMFAYASGTNDIGQFSTSPRTYTTDAGTGIASRYRTGFWNPGQPGAESVIRELMIDGTGTPSVKTASNDAATLGSAAAVTLGTAPAVAQGRDRRSTRGRNVSIELSASSGAWSASRVIANLRGQRNAGLKAT